MQYTLLHFKNLILIYKKTKIINNEVFKTIRTIQPSR
jgi:hypothetical protein